MPNRLLIMFLAVFGGAGSTLLADQPIVRVFCAAGMARPMHTLAAIHERESGVVVRINAASSGALARQILAGAEVDVYAAADPSWIDLLEQRGVAEPGARFPIAGNRLVVVSANQRPAKSDGSLASSLRAAEHVVVGDPAHVPVGRYAKDILSNMGVWQTLNDRLVRAHDVAAITRFIRSGAADLGIVYATEANAYPGLSVVGELADPSTGPIRFEGVVLGKSNGAAAGRFADLLVSSRGQAVFARAGYLLADGRETTSRAAPPVGEAPPRSIWPAVWLSLKVAAVATLIVIPPGVACGWLLARRRFVGKSIVEALVHLPLVMPPVVVGYVALRALGRDGWLGEPLASIGIRPAFTWHGAAIAAAIMAFPLLVRAVRVSVESVDLRIEQAARTLGAPPWRVAVRVTLPLAGAGIIGGIVLALARSFGEFGATITLAGNVAGQTQTLPLAIYSAIQTPGGEAVAMRLALISAAIATAALALSELTLRRARATMARSQHDRP